MGLAIGCAVTILGKLFTCVCGVPLSPSST